MPFALPGAIMPNHPGRRARKLRGSWGVAAGPPTLFALTLSNASFTQGATSGTVIGAIQGKTAGSTLSLSDDFSGAVAISGTNLVVGLSPPATPQTFNVSIVETLAGAIGSPKTTTLAVTEAAASVTRMLMTSRLNPPGMNGYTGSDGVDTDSNSRISVYNELGVTVTKFRALIPNWLLALAGEQAGFNSIGLRLGFEYPAGTITPVTVGGSGAPSAAVDALVETDDIAVSFPANAQGWFRTYVVVSAGQKWPLSYTINTARGEAADFNTGVDKSQGGTITNATATATRRGFGPAALVATQWTGTITRDRVVGFGDSYTDPRSLAVVDAKGNYGYLGLACGGRAPYMVMGFSGSTLATQPGNLVRRKALIAAAGVSIFAGQQGINDIALLNRAPALIAADRTSVISEIRTASPGIKVWWATIGPYTTSNNSWDNAAGQTFFNAQFAAGGASSRGLHNAGVRSASDLDRVIELGDALETNRDSGIWKSSDDDNIHIQKNFTATVTSGTTTVVNFTSTPSPTTDLFAFGGAVEGVTGVNAGVRKLVANNTATQFTLTTALATAPTAGDTFKLYSGRGRVTADGLHMQGVLTGEFGGLFIARDLVIPMLAT